MIKYNKLVRDRIPEIIEENGKECTFHVATKEEYNTKLREKLCEEAIEFLEDPRLEELVDVLEVIDAILKNEDYREFKGAQVAKRITNGGFEKCIILDGVKNS